MALEPEDAIPQEYLPAQPEPTAPMEQDTAPAEEVSDAAFLAFCLVPLVGGAAWMESNSLHSWWLAALLAVGGGFAASGYARGKYADPLQGGLAISAFGLYVYALVVADTISLRIWLALWLFDAFAIFGGGLLTVEAPDPQQEPQDRGPDEPASEA